MTLAVVGRHPAFLTPSLPPVFSQGVKGPGVGKLRLVLFRGATGGVCAALRLEGRGRSAPGLPCDFCLHLPPNPR